MHACMGIFLTSGEERKEGRKESLAFHGIRYSSSFPSPAARYIP